MLSACSTPTVAPCLLPPDALELAPPLPPIVPDEPDGKLSEKALTKTLTDDDAAYNTLAAKHNAGVNHIRKFCS